MPRRLRIEFEGAISHVRARGHARQDIVHDDDDRQRLLADLENTVGRTGWEVLTFVVLSHHLHLLIKTPQPHLARGMQRFLSRSAHWSARRRRRPGHLFQGRYKAELIEDESYSGTVRRSLPLNPVRAGLVPCPEHGPGSSDPGLVAPERRRPWVGTEALLAAGRGDCGGTDAVSASRRFVAEGLADPPPAPVRAPFGGGVLGSDGFLAHLRRRAGPVVADPPAPEARPRAGLDAETICSAGAADYGLESSSLSHRRDPHIAPRSRPGCAAAIRRRRFGAWPRGSVGRARPACRI